MSDSVDNATAGDEPVFFRRLYRRRVAEPFKEQIRRGVSRRCMAHSMSMGVVAAVYPQLGFTTIMALFLSFVFRLNYATAVAVKWLLSPLQFVFMIPFLRLGETLLGVEHFHTSIAEILRIVTTDPLGSFVVLGMPLVHAILGWILTCLVLYPVVYMVNGFIYDRVARTVRAGNLFIVGRLGRG